jgi:hypothetical protein
MMDSGCSSPYCGGRLDERNLRCSGRRGRGGRGPLDAGLFAADIASFELQLAAENKAAGAIRIYTEAPRWFAAARLLAETGNPGGIR